MKKILIIDGHSLLHRAFHALPDFTSPKGVPIGAVYGFAKMVLTMLQNNGFDIILVAWDTSTPTFRHQLFVDYKQHRPETDETLRSQIPLAQNFVSALNISQFSVPGYEADDIIGTVGALIVQHNNQLGEKKYHLSILSSDRDLLQLVNHDVSVVMTKKGITELETFDTNAVKEKYELAPDKLPDLKGLMGDSSDNIPGVKGVGIKTATKLLKDYGSLESVFAHVPQITGRTQTLLSEQQEIAYLSKKLATIATDAPLDIDILALDEPTVDYDGVTAFLAEHGFNSLIAMVHLLQNKQTTSQSAMSQVETNSSKDFVQLEAIAQDTSDNVLFVYFDDHSVWLNKNERLVQISWSDLATKKEVLSQVFQDNHVVTFDAKTLFHRMDSFGVVFEVACDLLILDAVVSQGAGDDKANELILKHLGQLAGQTDSSAIIKLMPRLYESCLEKMGDDVLLQQIFFEIEMPLVSILFRMEKSGIFVDKKVLRDIDDNLTRTLEKIMEEIFADIGHEINLNSPKQLEVILFDELRLPVIKKTKTQRSTNEQVLKQLKHAHPVIEKILTYRKVSKLQSTYTSKLHEHILHDGRIHSTFNQLRVVTARLSSEQPNMQNIPRDDDFGFRKVFVAGNGFELVALDYSQIELRILSHLSQDEHLQQSFVKKQDVHAATAARIFDCFIDEVTNTQRQIGKTINFAVMYGMGPNALAENLEIDYREAQKYIDEFFALYPQIKEWKEKTISFAKEHGYVKTLWGRKIAVKEITSSNKRLVAMGERMAVNYPNQGSQADFIKKAMVKVDALIRQNYHQDEARLLLQVHDELIFEVSQALVSKLVPLFKDEMEQVAQLSVPIVVEAKRGANLHDMTKI